ncbi:D-Tyr-tRNAtyr deacylase [Paenibacillus thiaminolyticus]|uniref:D-Tyr-tRNAtyr deacylase n=1 Tax=Paenibacillus thiaminolyticus TaxID=49283 RepID=A0A3A3GKZ5_PANTH|nr:D-Tyr-tRNAtyr deacylase [Paenibacillus thiaminolyticus]RJG23280.1 D-Tyr-tRNAtyr deacylase [Paenibacillus thiaminolyticus]
MTEPQAAVQAAECLFQSVIDFDTEAERVSVFVTMLFRNAGSEPIEQPRIILSVTPARSCDISGKILSPQLIPAFSVYGKDGRKSGWSFTEDEWFANGKATGEYIIQSIEPLTMPPGVWLEMPDFHVSCAIERLRDGPLAIHGLLEAGESHFPVLNPISIHCSF